MFEKAKAFMLDHLKAFGVDPLPPVIETRGKGVSLLQNEEGSVIVIGSATDTETLPLVEWMVATGKALLQQQGSDIVPLLLGNESENNKELLRIADDLFYIIDLAAIYQCYLQNPVEAYCIYDDAIELKDEESLHPIAVALGLSHPRGLEAMGFDKKEHAVVVEEAEFFKPIVIQKRPDLSLLIALQNAWQKQKGSDFRLRVEGQVLRFLSAA
ncbi:hypothetical protein [Sulfurimonas diazotrophicus]|uniref:Uncharacterized protein n=1 Tax=Sulfurimonas diazotrophicus TaxID=3131939 RepID=A0ABZ3HAS4_9BACT